MKGNIIIGRIYSHETNIKYSCVVVAKYFFLISFEDVSGYVRANSQNSRITDDLPCSGSSNSCRCH